MLGASSPGSSPSPARAAARGLALLLAFAPAACASRQGWTQFRYEGVKGSAAERGSLQWCVRTWDRVPAFAAARANVFAYLRGRHDRVVLVEYASLEEDTAYGYAIFTLSDRAVRGLLEGHPRLVPVDDPDLSRALATLTPARLDQVTGQDRGDIQDTDCCFLTVSDGRQTRQVGFTPCTFFNPELTRLLPGFFQFLETRRRGDVR